MMLSRVTGQSLNSELDSIRQSIGDILSTPIGSRVMRREYGSKVPNLIDQPVNQNLILQLYSAIYTALLKWENRISLEQITITTIAQGYLTLDLDAVYIVTDQKLNLNIPLKMGAV